MTELRLSIARVLTAATVLLAAHRVEAAAAPALETAYLNQTTDADGNPIPAWAWAPAIVEFSDGTLFVAYKASAKVGGAVNIETSDVSAIYFTTRQPSTSAWSVPVKSSFDTVAVAEGNPQLYLENNGELWITYFGRPRPANGNWTNDEGDSSLYLRKSSDRGLTWSAPSIVRGPGNNTGGSLSGNEIIKLANGSYLFPFYNTGNTGDYAGVLLSPDGEAPWSEIRIPQPATTAQSSMPSITQMPDGTLVAFMRCFGVNQIPAEQKLFRSLSSDNGLTWTTATPLPAIRNPNSRVDSLQLADGSFLLVGNDTVRVPNFDGASGRKEVNVMLTNDLGVSLLRRKTLALNYDGNPNGATKPEQAGVNLSLIHI